MSFIPNKETAPIKMWCSVFIFLFIVQSCRSLQEYSGQDKWKQPYILAIGTRNSIHEYYIILDGELLPRKAKSALSAFDELFKVHYVFGISYDQALNAMYTFVQTTIYNSDIGLSHETPRVVDLRAKLLNKCLGALFASPRLSLFKSCSIISSFHMHFILVRNFSWSVTKMDATRNFSRFQVSDDISIDTIMQNV